MVYGLTDALAKGFQIGTQEIDFDASLSPRGFMGSESNAAVGSPQVRYPIRVTGGAYAKNVKNSHHSAVAHSPNAQTILTNVALKGQIISTLL